MLCQLYYAITSKKFYNIAYDSQYLVLLLLLSKYIILNLKSSIKHSKIHNISPSIIIKYPSINSLYYNISQIIDMKQASLGQKLQKFYEPQFFHNHGDNPALKKFMQISTENIGEGRIHDFRTYFIDKSKRFMYARNWDDFLQRDLKAYTFPRAFGLFSLSSMALYTSLSWFTRLLPVGRFGIRKISQTSFYHNFGSLGVVGAVGMLFSAAYIEWKTFKFTIHKFYHHIILQERNWLLQQDKEPGYGQYYFKDNPLSADENFPHEARAEMAKKQRKTASLSLDKN